jgi:hypothetical protein
VFVNLQICAPVGGQNFTYNWNDGKREYGARSEASALYGDYIALFCGDALTSVDHYSSIPPFHSDGIKPTFLKAAYVHYVIESLICLCATVSFFIKKALRCPPPMCLNPKTNCGHGIFA